MEEQLLEHWFNGLCGAEELRSSQKAILTVAEVPAKLQPQLRSFVLSVTSKSPEMGTLRFTAATASAVLAHVISSTPDRGQTAIGDFDLPKYMHWVRF